MIISNQNFATKALAVGAQTIVFNHTEVESEGVVEYFLSMSGAGNNVGAITRIRVKADGIPIVETTTPFLRTYIERCSEANVAVATSAARFTIPLYNLEGITPIQKYASQFPRGRKVTIEIAITGAAVGTILLGWRQVDFPQAFYPILVSTPLNVAALQTNARYTFTRQGLIRTYAVNSVGLNRLRLVVGGIQVCNVDGATILEQQQMESGVTITDPICNTIEPELQAFDGSTYAEVDTAAGWAGVGNELFTAGFVPVSG